MGIGHRDQFDAHPGLSQQNMRPNLALLPKCCKWHGSGIACRARVHTYTHTHSHAHTHTGVAQHDVQQHHHQGQNAHTHTHTHTHTDYLPPPFWIKNVDLTFVLNEDATRVTSKLSLSPNYSTDGPVPTLVLNGRKDIKLVSVKVCACVCERE